MQSPPPLPSIGREILAFLLAASCAGCDSPGAVLCASCRAAVQPEPLEMRSPGGLLVRAAMPMRGVAARCIRKLKDDGETMLATVLGASLSVILHDALGSHGGVRRNAVPIPTRRAAYRRRGYRVPDLLIKRADEKPKRLLKTVGWRADQRGLGAVQRAMNVRGSLRVSRTIDTPVVLVDDVVTTGATFDEAARVLEEAGTQVVMAVALAATPRRKETTGGT